LRTVKMLLEPPPSELHLADIGASDLLKMGRIVKAGWPEYILRPARCARCRSCQMGLIGLNNGEPWAGSTSGRDSTTLQVMAWAAWQAKTSVFLDSMCDDPDKPETLVNSGSFDWVEQFCRASMLLSIAVLTSVFFDSTGCPLSHIQMAKRWLE
jgi:hypothetical protein